MSEAVETMKQRVPIIEKRPTLARRVSGMFKDGNYSGPPLLFRHASMQRLRHCCQNLNLLPYLLYSFGNSKSHPTVRNMHRQFARLTKSFLILLQLALQSMLRVVLIKHSVRFAANLRRALLKNIHYQNSLDSAYTFPTSVQKSEEKTVTEDKIELKFSKFKRRERQRISVLLTIAVYLALIVLVSQLIGIFSVMVTGKYPPGFIFMISALSCLAYIAMKIMAYDKYANGFKSEKRKSE